MDIQQSRELSVPYCGKTGTFLQESEKATDWSIFLYNDMPILWLSIASRRKEFLCSEAQILLSVPIRGAISFLDSC